MSEYSTKLNGITKSIGKYPECYPNEQTLKSMRAAGYKIYIDGKLVTGKAPSEKN